MPTITFEDDEDTVTGPTKDNVLLSIWAAKRWNTPALSVPGLVETPPENPNIAQRRALAIAMMLRQEGISPVPARAQGSSFRLTQPVQSAE